METIITGCIGATKGSIPSFLANQRHVMGSGSTLGRVLSLGLTGFENIC